MWWNKLPVVKKCLNKYYCKVVHGALVSSDYPKETIAGTFSNGSLLQRKENDGGLGCGATEGHKISYPEQVIDVPAVTLNRLLEMVPHWPALGVLVLDLEGMEYQALQGLDFERWKPEVIVVEIDTDENKLRIFDFLNAVGYRQAALLDKYNYVFLRKE